jgi:subtilisin family serine protease
MRKICWTLVIGLVLGLAAASSDRPGTGERRAADDSATRLAPFPDSSMGANDAVGAKPESRSSAAMGRLIPNESAIDDAADAASGNTVARRLGDLAPEARLAALEAEIERARAERGLRVDPAILVAMRETGRARVVFDLSDPTRPTDLADRLMDDEASARIEALRVFPLIGHAAARVGPDALHALIDDAAAHHIELDAIHRPALRESVTIVRADEARVDGHDGDGVAVAVLDTGVESSHPMLAGRLLEEACFSLLSHCPNAAPQMLGSGAAAPCSVGGCGHGTHVAGIAVGFDPSDDFAGVAPAAGLIAIQIFSEVAPGEIGAYTSDILAGLQHVLALAPFHRVAAVNLSVGGTVHTSEASCDEANGAQRSAVEQLRAAGITVVAASGNEGLTNAITSPACLSNVLSVGASGDRDGVAGFSNGAPFLSLLAPGRSIESAARGARRGLTSGTSAAAPHVAGAIAAIREAHPSAGVGEIENALALAGVPIVDGRNGETTPRVDVAATIELLSASSTTPPEGPADAASSIGSAANATASTASAGDGGGGGRCGLVGLEPFLVLGLVRLRRPLHRRRTRPAPRDA